MTFTREEALWIEGCVEAGDTIQEVAESGGYDEIDIRKLLTKAQHPSLKLSEFQRNVLSLWASGYTAARIAQILVRSRDNIRSVIELLRQRRLIWAQHPARARIRSECDEREELG